MLLLHEKNLWTEFDIMIESISGDNKSKSFLFLILCTIPMSNKTIIIKTMHITILQQYPKTNVFFNLLQYDYIRKTQHTYLWLYLNISI